MRHFLARLLTLMDPDFHSYTLRHARGLRRVTDSNIDQVVADLRICEEEWKLTPEVTLTECVPSDRDLRDD